VVSSLFFVVFFFFIFRLDDDDEETPDASSIHFRFVGGVLLEMIESAFHSLERKKKISLVVSDFNRDTSVAIATSFHHRGKVVCFSIVLPSRAMMMMMMKEDDGTPGEERKNERKKLLKASFFSLLGGKRKEKEEDNQFFFGAKISSFF